MFSRNHNSKNGKSLLIALLSLFMLATLPACSDSKKSKGGSEDPSTQPTSSSGGSSSSGSSSSSNGSSGGSSSGSSSGGTPPPPTPSAVSDLTWTGEVGSTFTFTWTDVSDATHYKLMENEDGNSGFSQIGQDVQQGNETSLFTVPITQKINAQYLIQSCNNNGCTDSSAISTNGDLATLSTFFKASNPEASDFFGEGAAISADGNTVAVFASSEDSNNQNDPSNNSTSLAGAIYIYSKTNNTWSFQAYLKAPTPDVGHRFGLNLGLSDDGSTLITASSYDDTGSADGKLYIYTRVNNSWSLQDDFDGTASEKFGQSASISGDGTVIAVGAVDADKVYVYSFSGASWSLTKTLTGSNGDGFGEAVALNQDGNILAITEVDEEKVTIVTDTSNWNSSEVLSIPDAKYDQVDISNDGLTIALSSTKEVVASQSSAGKAWIYKKENGSWNEKLAASAAAPVYNGFGKAIVLNNSATQFAVNETGNHESTQGFATSDGSSDDTYSGAVHKYSLQNDGTWSKTAFIKPNFITPYSARFGEGLAIDDQGHLLIGTIGERSNATNVNGDRTNTSLTAAGAAFLY